MKKGISLIVLIITIIIIIILAGAVILNLNDTNIIEKANEAKSLNDQAAKIEELNMIATNSYLEKYLNNTGCESNLSATFVQPWLAESFNYDQWLNHCDVLKQAEIDTIIIQWTADLEDGKIKKIYYESDLVNDSSNLASGFNNSYYNDTKSMLDDILRAAKEKNMKVVVGLAFGDDWWDNDFTDSTWRTNTINMINSIATEIYNKYKGVYPNTFDEWYWSYETYTTTENYEVDWASMMNGTFSHLTTLDNIMPVSISPFISQITEPTNERIYEQWNYIVNNAGFRSGDTIYLQDGLGTIDAFSSNQILDYIKEIKRATDTNINVDFGINIENFNDIDGSYTPANVDRVIQQMNISSAYAKKLICFSYFHYYNPLINGIDDSYHTKYLEFLGKEIVDTSDIPAPVGGSVYTDSNGDKAPIPNGFTVSNDVNENIIDDGLVILDTYGNEFVWIPVDGFNITYTKWCSSYDSTQDDTLPNGIVESDQIDKYKGFYIARYESAFDYNSGDIRVASKPSVANTDIGWSGSRDLSHDGYLWNYIQYEPAQVYSNEMASKYSYDSTISTSLITGTQWDTVMAWISDSGINVSNSTNWGNFNNSIAPANTGNYVQNTLQNSGSNENWKAKNIYDLAGNLREWNNELNSSSTDQMSMRSTDYMGNGEWGPAQYREFSGSWNMKNVGFRVAMYID